MTVHRRAWAALADEPRAAPGPAEEAPVARAAAGRSCPLHYRYRPEVFKAEAPMHLQSLEVIYVVGGLYGNDLALARVLDLFDRERGRKRLVFNGDFHWFDVDSAVFARVQAAVLAHEPLRGNVETELASDADESDTGCGCAYPDWVGDGVVERSNRILGRLRLAASAGQRTALAALPMWLRADVGPLRLGIMHGDATSLAGWGFAQEHLLDAGHRAEVDAFACTHTCLPVFQALQTSQRRQARQPMRWILNNGAAGMPNFRGDTAGLLTRIAVTPFAGPQRRFATTIGQHVVAEAIAIDIDTQAWRDRFLTQWPAGSDAHVSYFDRILRGPAYEPAQAVRCED